MWRNAFLLLVTGFVSWIFWRIKRFSYLNELGIPGPKPSLLFGNFPEFAEKTPLVCIQEWTKKYGKVFGYYMGAIPVLVVSDVELLKKIQISEFHKFPNRNLFYLIRGRKPKKGDGFMNQLIGLRDKRWKELRSLLAPSFTSSKMKLMAPAMNDAIDTFMEKIDQKSRDTEAFDIYELYKGLTADIVGRTAFGVKSDFQNNPENVLLKASEANFGGNIGGRLTMLTLSFPEMGFFWNSVCLVRRLFKYSGMDYERQLVACISDVIRLRKSDPSNRRNDLLQIMIDANMTHEKINQLTNADLTVDETSRDKTESEVITGETPNYQKNVRFMDEYEIVDNAILLFLAGYETTSNALTFTTHFLIHYPDIQERVRDEVRDVVKREGSLSAESVQKLQYLGQVIIESLRMYPPIYLGVTRDASNGVTLGTFKLKKGLDILMPPYVIHHDEDYWPDSWKFDPDRFLPENKPNNNPLAFQAFGNGPRNCIGMRFALLETRLALARLLLKYRLLACERTDKLHLGLKTSALSLKPRNGIYLKVEPL